MELGDETVFVDFAIRQGTTEERASPFPAVGPDNGNIYLA